MARHKVILSDKDIECLNSAAGFMLAGPWDEPRDTGLFTYKELEQAQERLVKYKSKLQQAIGNRKPLI